MKKVVLHGKLKDVYADELFFDINSVAEAIRAMYYQIDGFPEAIREGHYRIVTEHNDDIPEEALTFKLGSEVREIHIVPALEGSKGGVFRVVAGVALVGLAVATGGAAAGVAGLGITGGGALTTSASFAAATGGFAISSSTLATMGASLLLGGISQMMTPSVKPPEAQSFERPADRPSYLYNGATNTSEQGGPVPLIYGQMRVGSVVVSAGIQTEDISVGSEGEFIDSSLIEVGDGT